MRVLAVSFALVLVTSCGGGDPLTRIESTYNGMVDSICRSCPAAAGASTEAECRTMAAASNPFQGTQWDCQRNAYHMYPNELGPYYDCVSRAVSSYDGCMRNAVRTCPPASADVTACGDALNSAIRACPLPDSIAASQAVSMCFSHP